MGILPLASPPAIDNAGDESAHFRNSMRRERVWRVRGEAELCAAWRANSHDYAGLLGECWNPVPLPPPAPPPSSRVAGRERSAPRPSSRCQTARFAASAAQHISFPRRIFCARVVASCFFVSTASPQHLPALRRARAPVLGVSCSSDPEMRGRRSAGRRTTLVRRASKTRPHACEACPSRATGTSASRRSTVALPGPRCVSGISAGAGARLARRPSFMAGYGPRVRPRLRAAADATPRSAVRIVSGDAPHERG